MLYTLYGKQTNGKICMPATKQEIVDYCMNNPEIAKAIFDSYGNKEHYGFATRHTSSVEDLAIETAFNKSLKLEPTRENRL